MRIPFDISKRPQIESGEYKVIYVEYPSTNQYPVEILKWDSNSDAGCIIGCVRRKGKDRIYAFQENGVHTVSDEDDRLFLVTPEPEMSEFEKRLQEVLFEHATTNSSAEEKAHQYSFELLVLAKQQLLQSGELLTQEHHEKLMETQYNETLDGVKKNWHDYFTPQAVTDIYNAGRNDVLNEKRKIIVANLTEDKITGIQHDIIEFLSNMMDARWIDIVKTADAYAERIRAEALKDLPRWRNVEADKRYVGCVTRYMDVNGDWNYCMSSGKLSDDCQYISIAALEKLPQEEKDHE